MKILFVYPNRDTPYFKEEGRRINIFHHIMYKIAPFTKPLTLSLLAGIATKKHDIELLDGGIKDVNFNKGYDLVGIHCVTSTAFMAYDIADEFRKRGVPVVLGGWHPSALPEEAKQHADAVVVGEAEETLPQLLNDLEKGKMKSFYYPTRAVDPSLIPYPLDMFPKKGGVYGSQATRGCPNRCEFCAITHMKYRNIFRMRPIENVIHEIQSYPGGHIAFADNSLTINPKYTKELFKQIKINCINKTFSAFGNVGVLAKDEELLKLSRQAGITSWFIGFESISQETLKSIGKNTNKVKEYKLAIKKIHENGISIRGTFIFGFDTDTIDIFDKTDEFVKTNEIDLPEPLVLTPFPGTPLFDKLVKEKRILTQDWNKYDLKHVVFQPKNMTPEQLLTHNRDLFKGWYTNPRIFRRMIKNLKYGHHNLIDTFICNYLLKAWM